MAGKNKVIYCCKECGYEASKWYGKCPGCGQWNTMQEELSAPVSSVIGPTGTHTPSAKAVYLRDLSLEEGEKRYKTGMPELDRVLGGGLVKGSLVLLGGEPGIGKSPLLMQICRTLGENMTILYVSGEESAHQLKLRANRLGVNASGLMILAETSLESVVEQMRAVSPDVVIVDSIQTMNCAAVTSSPGSVTQVRECTNLLMRAAKGMDIPVFWWGMSTRTGPSQARRCWNTLWIPSSPLKGNAISPTACCGPSKTAMDPPMRLAYLRCVIPAFVRFPTPL